MPKVAEETVEPTSKSTTTPDQVEAVEIVLTISAGQTADWTGPASAPFTQETGIKESRAQTKKTQMAG